MKFSFTSTTEKRLWIMAAIGLLGILISIFGPGNLVSFEFIQSHQTDIYVGSFFVIVGLILLFRLSSRLIGPLIFGIAGILIIYLMVLVRLGMSANERTHLFEYGFLAMLIYQAVLERKRNGDKIKFAELKTFGIVLMIGILDEGIQFILPNRVFDLADILFNSLAAIGAILSNWLLELIIKRLTKTKSDDSREVS